MSTLLRHKCFVYLSIKCHITPDFCQNHSSTFLYGPILMKICMNVNIMKTQYMIWKVTFMLSGSYVIFCLFLNWGKINTSMTSKVIQGHKRQPFYLKIHFFFCYWLIEETNAAEYNERKKFVLYKDDICLFEVLDKRWLFLEYWRRI